MTLYQIKLKAVFDWCQSCEWDFDNYYRLISRIHNIVHYRRLWLQMTAPEDVSKAAESLESATEDLLCFMQVRCFPPKVKGYVLWLVSHTH